MYSANKVNFMKNTNMSANESKTQNILECKGPNGVMGYFDEISPIKKNSMLVLSSLYLTKQTKEYP